MIWAIKKANSGWIDLKIIIEKEHLGIPNTTFNAEFKDPWLNISYLDSVRLNFIIIDNDVIILDSGDLLFSVVIKDELFLKTMLDVFSSDFIWEVLPFYHDNLLLWPEYLSKKLENFIDSAQKEIYIYTNDINDDFLLPLLYRKSGQWLDINIITNQNKVNNDIIEKLKGKWLRIKDNRYGNFDFVYILIDGKYLYIWNESDFFNKSRSLGVILKDKWVIHKFLEKFNLDFKK